MDPFLREFDAGPDDVIEVTLDAEANVRLMNRSNYSLYESGESYHYYGGPTRKSSMRLVPPYQDRWYVVVDLGGREGTVTASAELLKG